MGKRSIIKRLPLTRNQKVSYPYSKNNPRGRPRSSIRKKYKIKQQSKEDDSSYILPSNTEESVDFDKLDLEEETINSELNSPVIDLTQDDSEEEEEKEKKYPKIRTKRSERKSRSRSVIKRIRKIKKKGENMNSFAELNHCYTKLTDLIDEYNFEDIADAILKLNNNIKRNKADEKETAIYKELKKINSVIKKKDDIIMMCLSILNSRKAAKNKDNKDKNNEKIKPKKELSSNSVKEKKADDEIVETGVEHLKEKSFLNSFKELSNSNCNYKYGWHYYNSKNGVYIYEPREAKRKENFTFQCKKYIAGCRAKCVVYKNSDVVTMKGTHNHNGSSYSYFLKLNPEFKNKNWEHVQVIKENGKEIIIKQC